ncbi:NAD-dependent epimerase/dehydratase family protein [Pseudochrobactrum sp. XF203]|uniref:NAD-dependent epimerase/dehydratase family protein n=1 Tax=Pseudochrobactrum sp. XF203 TaxID=2879116 RepID=UPI001CE2FC97|nr:NAD-dependent epimerase/dehydratase family protein [Pseudochrobactrum sp. XF203]UCA47067.1 NAD-dependent epimerase/dehydratase family protein [Pseudochrobactrum sp. XF203]
MRYVVTGGSGFIGLAVSKLLKSLGHEVIIASRRVHDTDGYEWVEFDNNRTETISNITSLEPDGVFHLAWSSIPSSAQQSPGMDFRTNLAGTAELFSALSRADIRTVFTSSGGTVYGQAKIVPTPEDHPLAPISMYGVGKVSAEVCARSLQAVSNFDVRIARISNPFGSTNLNGKAQGVASIFARRILLGDEITLMGDGAVVRDYLHVDDVASALFAIMEANIISSIDNVFNVGSGVGLSINDIVDTISHEAGVRPNINRRPSRNYDVKVSVLDITKAYETFAWRPKYIGADGLSYLVKEIKKELSLLKSI